MQTILLFVHLVVCVGLILLVLMQRSEGGALGVGGGGGSFISSRGAANLLVRLTTIAGIIFFGTSITLSLLGEQASAERNRSVTDAPISSIVVPEEPLALSPEGEGTALAPGSVPVAPPPSAAAERAGPALLSPAPAAAAPPASSAARVATLSPPRPAAPASSSRPAPAATEAPAAPAPAVVDTPAPTLEPTTPPVRQRAGPDQ